MAERVANPAEARTRERVEKCRMVGAKGFEPSTPCTPCRCATRLRYAPTEPMIISGSWIPAYAGMTDVLFERIAG